MFGTVPVLPNRLKVKAKGGREGKGELVTSHVRFFGGRAFLIACVCAVAVAMAIVVNFGTGKRPGTASYKTAVTAKFAGHDSASVSPTLPSGIAAALGEQGESYTGAPANTVAAIDQDGAEAAAVASSGVGTEVLAAQLVTYHAAYGTGLVWLVSVDPPGQHVQVSWGPNGGVSPYNYDVYFVDPSSGAVERVTVGTSSELPSLPSNP